MARAIRSLAVLSLALTTVASAHVAYAQSIVRELRAGVLWHDVPELWSGFQLERNSIDINGEIVFAPGLPFLFGMIRPALGGTVSTVGDTSHAYLDARWEIEGPAGLFVGLGLGAAIHDGYLQPERYDRKALGSRLLFHIPFEIGLRFDQHNSISVYFEHTSNANTKDDNEGLDRLGIRYGYKF